MAGVERSLQRLVDLSICQTEVTPIMNIRVKPPATSNHESVSLATVSHTKFYALPLGNIELKRGRRYRRSSSDQSTDDKLSQSEINITFVPPSWLSCLALRCSIQFHRHDLERETLRTNLRPITVNHNPLLRETIDNQDIDGLQKLLRAGKVHATDHVVDVNYELKSLGDVSIEGNGLVWRKK